MLGRLRRAAERTPAARDALARGEGRRQRAGALRLAQLQAAERDEPCLGIYLTDPAPTHPFDISYNINLMSERETINGVPVNDEQIAAWVDEAEAGYDVEALKKRGRGRPGRGSEPSQVVALRLTLEEVASLDERAEREGKTRSEVIREALTTA